MSIYRYPESKIIDEVTFRRSARNAVRAYLHGRPDISAATVQEVMDKLRAANLECIPYDLDGKPTLEVRGFRSEAQLVKIMDQAGWLGGNGALVKGQNGHVSWLDKLKKRTLQLSGLFYVIGDINFVRYGWKEDRWEDMLGGLMYAGGTASLLGYGRNDQSDIQVKDLSRRITRHLLKEGIKLDDKWALTQMAEEDGKGVLSSIDGTFRRYPSEMFNLFTGLAGACIATSALRYKVLSKKSHHPDEKVIFNIPKEREIFRKAGFLDLGLGVMTMASTAVGGLVKERAHDPDKPKSEGVQAILDWVRERPLTIAGAGLMVSTGLHAISSWLEYRQAKRLNLEKRADAIKNRVWFVATNLAAEFLIAVSSKGHGEGIVSDKSVDTSVIALAADLIVRQPKNMHDHLIDYMAKFLGRADVLAMKNEEVAKLLRTQVEAMRKNPWAQPAQAQEPRAPETTVVKTRPELAWTGRTSGAGASIPQPGR